MIAHAKALPARRIVLTGGPGAGKTAVLEFLRKAVCDCTVLLPESAGIVFGGGFPRETSDGARRAAQRAIYFVQRELEAYADFTMPASCCATAAFRTAWLTGPVLRISGDRWAMTATAFSPGTTR